MLLLGWWVTRSLCWPSRHLESVRLPKITTSVLMRFRYLFLSPICHRLFVHISSDLLAISPWLSACPLDQNLSKNKNYLFFLQTFVFLFHPSCQSESISFVLLNMWWPWFFGLSFSDVPISQVLLSTFKLNTTFHFVKSRRWSPSPAQVGAKITFTSARLRGNLKVQ